MPVLYAADTPKAAVCETILHSVPLRNGKILYPSFADGVAATIATTRELKLAAFMGDGLRVLGTDAGTLSATTASQYSRTVRWAEAAYKSGFHGVVWMSYRRNTDAAFVLFGDRVGVRDLTPTTTGGVIFSAGPGFDWLVSHC
ncbi:RES family NAD+ phosphorylase [Paenarthrobacter sp. PH39-S1]|uniref:RES family NAD+ phosphorylase n=1 Tax=Paenarthrobacter sp. PH39-S1 TaxID=3046204 RepID=UPI0024B8F31F|nr:RES family NAD+ phosphorylase [Paenarthrobacter sp. PH39-S1]MDJ0356246.1 RES family NAD+ phosphorylase [Paenarthrobacter sp. PH39-S1]